MVLYRYDVTHGTGSVGGFFDTLVFACAVLLGALRSEKAEQKERV